MSKIFFIFILFLFLFNSIITNEIYLDENSVNECQTIVDSCNNVNITYYGGDKNPYKCCEVSYKYDNNNIKYCVVINNKFGNYFSNYKKSLKSKYSKVKIKCKGNNINNKNLILFGLLILIL